MLVRLTSPASNFDQNKLVSFQTPGCNNGLQFLETCFEVPEKSFEVKIVANPPKIVTIYPIIETNSLKVVTNPPPQKSD